MSDKWTETILSSIYSIKYGKANPRRKGKIPVIGSSGVYDYTESALVTYPTIIVGRKGSAGQAWLMKGPCYPSDTTFYLEPKNDDQISIDYIYFALKQYNIEASKDVIPSLQRHELENLELLLPSEKEQRAIASVLSKIQSAVETQDKIIAKLKELKSATMAKLFREGLRGEKLKQTEIGEMPESWEVTRIDEHCEKPRYGYTASAVSKPVGPKFLRITDITENGVDWGTVPYCPCPETIQKELELKAGDLVFARIGATTGKSYLIDKCPKAVFASYLIRLRTKTKLDPVYLSYFFESGEYWQQIDANKGSSLKGGMNGSILSSLIFPLPPIKEQKIIAYNLRTISNQISCVVEQREKLQTLFSSMLNALMTGQVRVTDLKWVHQ